MNSERISKLRIHTPEGVTFSFFLASPVERFLAVGLDWVCALVFAQATAGMAGVLAPASPDFAMALMAVIFFVCFTLYPMLTEWFWRGQTLGKRLLHLRVMDQQGLRLEFSQIVLRNLLRYVDFLPACYLLGGAVAFFSRRVQRLGDMAAGTIVVRTDRPATPDLEHIMAGKYNTLRDYPLQQARLRQRVLPEEAALALQAVTRRNKLSDDARVHLFADIAQHFRKIADFPEQATAGMSDEHFVRNIVDLLFREQQRRPLSAAGTELSARKRKD